MEEGRDGRGEEGKDGRCGGMEDVEGWKDGRMEEGKKGWTRDTTAEDSMRGWYTPCGVLI